MHVRSLEPKITSGHQQCHTGFLGGEAWPPGWGTVLACGPHETRGRVPVSCFRLLYPVRADWSATVVSTQLTGTSRQLRDAL
eukprot:s3576_g14.t1